MARIRLLCAFVLGLMTGGSPILAQDVYVQNEEQRIILPGIKSWAGTAQELRRINRIAVPSSYRALCEVEGLSYTSLIAGVTRTYCHHSLVNWHFDFGTAPSAEKALNYISERLVRDYNLSQKDAERYIELLPKGLAEAEAYFAEEGFSYEEFREKNRVIDGESYPALAELRSLREKLTKSSHIAALYISAASWHRSPSLLEEATRWHGYLPDETILAAKDNLSDNDRLLRRVAYFRRDEFLELSLAVARAATERTEENILAAHEASARALDAQDRNFLDRSGWQQSIYRYLRSRIQLLADLEGLDVRRHEGVYLGDYDFRDIEVAMLPDERGLDELSRSAPRQFVEAMIAQGEHAVQVKPDCTGDEYNHTESLTVLSNGGRVVSPAYRPAAYLRIAELYVDLYAILEKCKDEEERSYADRYGSAIQKRIYQQFIDNYDEIALGR